MSFVEAVEAGYQNYFNFTGRATRPAYWYFVLWGTIVAVTWVLFMVIAILSYKTNQALAVVGFIMAALSGLMVLANVIPSYSAAVRRLHDMGRGGGWVGWPLVMNIVMQMLGVANRGSPDLGLLGIQVVLSLAYLVITLVVFVFLCQPSREAGNRFAGR